MLKVVARDAIVDAVMSINTWHQNTPLLLVFSRQRPGVEGNVSGNVTAVRAAYDTLFGLDRIGIHDDAHKFYLHMCHDKGGDYPYCIRKPTDNYGKTHQRIIKDTFANPGGFLIRRDAGEYTLKPEFAVAALKYLGLGAPLDIRPLVLFHYWNRVNESTQIGELWSRFSLEFGTDRPPFDGIFTCSQLDEPIPIQDWDSTPFNMKELCLPHEYGSGRIDADFWRRFRVHMTGELESIKWQGDSRMLVDAVASGLMYDQSIFLLGAPGTGKSTLVTQAILPAIRKAYGLENEVRFAEFVITAETTQSTLLGFQGLDGNWIMGPLGKELLLPYANVGETHNSESDGTEEKVDIPDQVAEQDVPRLIFFDEANRVDIEALLAPVQLALDRMQQRKEPGTVYLGKDEYVLPKRVWRVFAGNSPVEDTGRRTQSRPFKRRISVVTPPDVLDAIISNSSRFQSMAMALLSKAGSSDDPEVSEAAISLLSHWTQNSDSLEDLRRLLHAVRKLPRVALTVGLVESTLLRAATHTVLGRELAIDVALCQTFVGLLSGDYDSIQEVLVTAQEAPFPNFALLIQRYVLGGTSPELSFDIDSIL